MEPTTNPNPLVGGWTPEEKTSLLHLREAMSRITTLIETQCGTVLGREDADRAVVQGYYELCQCTGWLFHVNVNPNDAAGEDLLAKPRPDVVATAWKELNRAKYELGKAAATYVGNIHYDTARSEIDLVDTALEYATPYPVGYPTQFGPHGDYRTAQKSLWLTIQYGGPAMRDWLDGQKTGALPLAPGMFRDYGRCLRLSQVHTWFLSAHVIDATNATFSNFMTPFVLSLPEDDPNGVKRALTELQLVFGPNNGGIRHATYQMRFVLTSIGEALQSSNPSLASVLIRLADSWTSGLDGWGGHFSKITQLP